MDRKTLISLLIGSFWLVFLAVLFIVTIPIPIKISFFHRANIFSIVPQGWSFFTRNPREPQYMVYESNTKKRISKTNSDTSYWFGASRENRLNGIELSLVLSKTKKNLWVSSKSEDFKLERVHVPDTVEYNMYPKNLSGELYIVKQERLPWAWAGSYEKVVMPYEYILVYVK